MYFLLGLMMILFILFICTLIVKNILDIQIKINLLKNTKIVKIKKLTENKGA